MDVGYMETLIFNYPIREWRQENNNDELLKVLNKIMDCIDQNNNTNEMKKLANELSDERRITENDMTNYLKTDFERNKKPNVNRRRKSYLDDYLNSSADFE